MTAILNSNMYRAEIVYDRETHDYAMYLDGELCGFARTYSDAEVTLSQLRFELLTGSYFDRPQFKADPEERDGPQDTGEPGGPNPDADEAMFALARSIPLIPFTLDRAFIAEIETAQRYVAAVRRWM